MFDVVCMSCIPGEGAVVSEFSSRSRDEADIFTDEDIKRTQEIIG